jgi:hypothetical protein
LVVSLGWGFGITAKGENACWLPAMIAQQSENSVRVPDVEDVVHRPDAAGTMENVVPEGRSRISRLRRLLRLLVKRMRFGVGPVLELSPVRVLAMRHVDANTVQCQSRL